jgi:hypothetical protein
MEKSVTSKLLNLGSICENLSWTNVCEIKGIEKKDNELTGIVSEADFLESEVWHDSLGSEGRSCLPGHKGRANGY